MAAPDQTREPCPDRILDDIGGAFSMGAVGGSVFHFLKGVKNSPKGERVVGGVQAIRMNAPRVGGSFAVWGGLFSTFDCSMVYIRQKEDPWNSIIAGAATGGFLQMRHGTRAATRSAIFGGLILALIEGAGLMMNRVLSAVPQMPPEEPQSPPGSILSGGIPGQAIPAPTGGEAPSPGGFGSWVGDLFGGKKEEPPKPSSGDGFGGFDSGSGTSVPNFEFK